MHVRAVRAAAIPFLALALLCGGGAQAQYNYGGSSYSDYQDQGFFLLLDLMAANIRNTDTVVATIESPGTTVTAIPDWDTEPAGRFGLGYQWSSGNRIGLSIWGFTAEQSAADVGAPGSTVHFAIGPPIPDGQGGYIANRGNPGTFDILTEVEARTADLYWSADRNLGDSFEVGWTVGLRYAYYEEESSGLYGQAVGIDPGSGLTEAFKRNVGEMFGARLGLRGTYRFLEQWGITGGLAYSALDGEVRSASALTPTGTSGGQPLPQQAFRLIDDGRSGSIVDLDVAFVWFSRSGAMRVSLGWEQSTWNDIAADLARNFPGTTAPLRERDSVAFSQYKVGLFFVF